MAFSIRALSTEPDPVQSVQWRVLPEQLLRSTPCLAHYLRALFVADREHPLGALEFRQLSLGDPERSRKRLAEVEAAPSDGFLERRIESVLRILDTFIRDGSLTGLVMSAFDNFNAHDVIGNGRIAFGFCVSEHGMPCEPAEAVVAWVEERVARIVAIAREVHPTP